MFSISLRVQRLYAVYLCAPEKKVVMKNPLIEVKMEWSLVVMGPFRDEGWCVIPNISYMMWGEYEPNVYMLIMC